MSKVVQKKERQNGDKFLRVRSLLSGLALEIENLAKACPEVTETRTGPKFTKGGRATKVYFRQLSSVHVGLAIQEGVSVQYLWVFTQDMWKTIDKLSAVLKEKNISLSEKEVS